MALVRAHGYASAAARVRDAPAAAQLFHLMRPVSRPQSRPSPFSAAVRRTLHQLAGRASVTDCGEDIESQIQFSLLTWS